jgi:hypothetical protein
MVRKLSISIVAVICFLLIPVAPAPVGAQQELPPTILYGKETLKGIGAVSVVVENLSDDAIQGGLTMEQLQTDVEVKLRTAGIRIYDQSDASPEATSEYYANGAPYLYVRVSANASDIAPTFAVDVEVKLSEFVRMYDDPSKVTMAPIWQTPGFIGLVGTNWFQEDVRQKVKDEVDVFINDYLTVNPKD